MGLDMFIFSIKKKDTEEWGNNQLQKKFYDYDKEDKKKLNYDEVAYWRKANHIHKYFVDKVQDGVDNCEPHFIKKEHLEKLQNKCEAILKAHELKCDIEEVGAMELPTATGFFFGSYDYDDYYIQDIKDTLKQIKPLIENIDKDMRYFYYSSW